MEFFQGPTFASHTREGVSDPQIIPEGFNAQRFGLPGEERRRKLAEREARAWGTQSGSELQ